MSKESSYKDKFDRLNPWIGDILDIIKRDLKNDHLKNDWKFFKKNFPGKNLNNITFEDIVEAYSRVLQEDESSEQIGEFIATRWMMKNSEIYSFFEEKLKAIQPNFQELSMIEKEPAFAIMDEAASQFGPLRILVFSVLNSVVFPEEVFQKLEEKTKSHKEVRQAEMVKEAEATSLAAAKDAYELKIARLTDKYEKKLSGLQKKYIQDTDSLKKQLANLRKELTVNAR